MPPVNPQGSRTALVTWTVVTSFLFVTATIFAIYFYVEKSSVQQRHDERKKHYENIVAEGALNSADVAALLDLKSKPDSPYNASQGALDVAMKRAELEAKL